MIAAIYARKSTEQNGREDKAKSVPGQVDGARHFINMRGWTLDDTEIGTKQAKGPDGKPVDRPVLRHIYEDDGVSGALFADRAEFQRMMRDASAGAFEAVVFYDLDRFGRNAEKTMAALYELADLGVEVWDYSTGQAIDLDSFEGEMSTSFKAMLGQYQRAQARKHTRAAMRRKAEQGWHTHGKVFGYDLDRIGTGHCELRVNELEKQVVREIYSRFADGEGVRSIALALNRRQVPAPRAQQSRVDGWSVSTIRAVLQRPLYRGEIIYGRSAKAYGRELRKVYRHTKREKGQVSKPEETWVRTEKPELRIIDVDLAERVDARRTDRRTRYLASLANGDRVPERAHGKYLLSGGMLVCPTCGGHFEARKWPWKGNPGDVYMCATRRRKPGVCTNTLTLPITETDATVLSIIEGEVLGPRVISDLLALVDTTPDPTGHLVAERDRLAREISNLMDLAANGIPADTIAPKIRERQTTLARVETQLRTPRPAAPDLEKLRAALEQRAEAWKADLRAEPKIARLVLRRIVGPLTLWDEPRPEWCRWEATTQPERLLEGIWSNRGTSPTGFEPVFWP
jgi:site-specific DNA recombinase